MLCILFVIGLLDVLISNVYCQMIVTSVQPTVATFSPSEPSNLFLLRIAGAVAAGILCCCCCLFVCVVCYRCGYEENDDDSEVDGVGTIVFFFQKKPKSLSLFYREHGNLIHYANQIGKIV